MYWTTRCQWKSDTQLTHVIWIHINFSRLVAWIDIMNKRESTARKECTRKWYNAYLFRLFWIYVVWVNWRLVKSGYAHYVMLLNTKTNESEDRALVSEVSSKSRTLLLLITCRACSLWTMFTEVFEEESRCEQSNRQKFIRWNLFPGHFGILS